MKNKNSFNSEQILQVNNQIYKYFDLKIVAKKLNIDLSRVPISIKIILENLIRNEDGENINKETISNAFKSVIKQGSEAQEISFFPTRVLMQDFTGVPAVADLIISSFLVIFCDSVVILGLIFIIFRTRTSLK